MESSTCRSGAICKLGSSYLARDGRIAWWVRELFGFSVLPKIFLHLSGMPFLHTFPYSINLYFMSIALISCLLLLFHSYMIAPWKLGPCLATPLCPGSKGGIRLIGKDLAIFLSGIFPSTSISPTLSPPLTWWKMLLCPMALDSLSS